MRLCNLWRAWLLIPRIDTVLLLCKVLVHFQCGHAPGRGGGDGLAKNGILNVSCRKDPGHAGVSLCIRLDVPVLIQIYLSPEDFGVGVVPDGAKEPLDFEGCPICAEKNRIEDKWEFYLKTLPGAIA